jgi:hypothetical protein
VFDLNRFVTAASDAENSGGSLRVNHGNDGNHGLGERKYSATGAGSGRWPKPTV